MKSKTLRSLFAAAVITVAASSVTGCYYYDHDHDHWRGDRYGYRYDRDDYWHHWHGWDRDDYRYSRFNRHDPDHDND